MFPSCQRAMESRLPARGDATVCAVRTVVAALVLVAVARVADATPPEPKGPHPRMLLDATLQRDLRTYGKLPVGPVAGAIKLCDEARTTDEHRRALYQGAEW